MKIELSQNGWLSLERNGKLEMQYCPFFSVGHKEGCGTWCPLFDEPKTKESVMPKFIGVSINICQDRVLSCPLDEFKDLRKKV